MIRPIDCCRPMQCIFKSGPCCAVKFQWCTVAHMEERLKSCTNGLQNRSNKQPNTKYMQTLPMSIMNLWRLSFFKIECSSVGKGWSNLHCTAFTRIVQKFITLHKCEVMCNPVFKRDQAVATAAALKEGVILFSLINGVHQPYNAMYDHCTTAWIQNTKWTNTK